jgi:gliding motility-associatede transport system auxiliary component
MAEKSTEIKKSRIQKYYKFILYIVIIVLVNLVGISLFFRADLTSNNLYSLSNASKKVVKTLNEPLTVNVFFSKNLPAPYNNIELYLHDLLAEYEIYSNNNLSYRFYNVTAEEDDISNRAKKNREIAGSYGIHPVSVRKIAQDETKVQSAYMGIAMIHGDLVEKIPAVTSTEGLEYKITNAIRKMNNKISALVNLPEKIKVTLVLSSSISQINRKLKIQGLDGLKNNVREAVQKLNDKTYGQLQFLHIDPSMGEGSPEQMKLFERFGIKWPQLQAEDGSDIQAGQGILALGMSYGSRSVEMRLLTSNLAVTGRGLEEKYGIPDAKAIETFVNDNIDNLIDINDDIGFLASHGALPLSVNIPPQMRMQQQQMPESLEDFNQLLSSEYSIKEVKLTDGIPDNIDTLIIAGAKENFSDYDLFQIDQFLMKGKSLALFLDAFNEIQPRQQQRGGFQQPVYLPINTGLEKLIDHYGIKIKKSYVLDENCFVNRGRQGEDMKIYPAPMIKNEMINHDLDFMENIKMLASFKMSPLDADGDKIKKNNLKLHTLFSSSHQSWEMSGRINLMPFMIQPPKDDKEKASKPLAYLLEGEFPSYYADKPVPEKPKEEEKKEDDPAATGDDKAKEKAKPEMKPEVFKSGVQGEKVVLNRGKPGKIFLIGSSEMLKGQMLKLMKGNPNDQTSYSPNEALLLNTIDYLNNRSDIAVMRGKNQRFNPLNDTKPFTRFAVKWFNVLGIPILFILLGVFIWFSRRSRRKMIRQIFSGTK